MEKKRKKNKTPRMKHRIDGKKEPERIIRKETEKKKKQKKH